MAGSYSKMVIIGNLGADPDMQYTASGQAVTHFRVAVNERRPAADNQVQELTQWFRVTCWGEQAETVTPQLHKGSLVYVEGSLLVNDFTGSDGQQRFSLDIRARDVKVLDTRGGAGSEEPEPEADAAVMREQPAAPSASRTQPAAPSRPARQAAPPAQKDSDGESALEDIPF